jgi:hypothetical protein
MEHLKNLISWGNSKVPHPVFNLGSATDCPSDAKGLCLVSEECYAKKAERLYKQVLPYRRRQREYWDNCGVIQFIDEFIEACGDRNVGVLRINEASDFRNQDDLDKLEQIARLFDIAYAIDVYVYTARRDLDFSAIRSLKVVGSSFMLDNMFIASNDAKNHAELARKMGVNAVMCGGDCYKCDLCLTQRGLTVFAQKH